MFPHMSALAPYRDTSLDEFLRRAVEVWRQRHGMSARRFGMEALGDPDFVLSQVRGRSVRLVTADRVLAFMECPPLGPVFRREVDLFLEVTGTKVSVMGEEAAGNPSFVGRLRRGASPRLRTVDRVRGWMNDHMTADELDTIRLRARSARVFGNYSPNDLLNFSASHGEAGVEEGEEGGTRMNENGSKYLNNREAAAWLNLSPRTLDRYRVSGDGPAFHRFGGRVRYLIADLETWAFARRRVSTSDDGTTLRRAAR